MPNQDLFKAYQQGIKETQKSKFHKTCKNILSSSNASIGDLEYSEFPRDSRLKISGMIENEKGGKEFQGSLFTTFSEHYEKLTSLPRRIRRAMQRKWKHSLAGIALVLALGGSPALGADFNVGGGNVEDLIQAINDANSNGQADNIILDGSTFTLTQDDNTTSGPTGLPLISTEITIQGNGSTIERDSTDPFRIFAVGEIMANMGNLTLIETIVSNGSVTGADAAAVGGGIIVYEGVLTLDRSTITGNYAIEDGGGIWCFDNGNPAGIITIIDSTIIDNEAGESGGGIETDCEITIEKSLITGNMAGEDGGGIYSTGSGFSLVNSTVHDNEAQQDAGGIYIIGEDNEFIINSTITGNTAGNEGGGVYNENDSDISITNSIVSGNTAGAVMYGNNCYRGVTDGGNNLSNDNNNDFSAMNASDFLCFDPSTVMTSETDFDSDNCLGPLADNGGPTQTIALISSGMNGCTTNLAIGGGNDATCTSDPVNSVDQRGIPRPQMEFCDIGAFELVDQNDNGVDDCLELGEFGDEDGNGVADNCDALINPEELITPAPTMSQWGMIAFGFIAGLFGLRFLRKKKICHSE